MSIRSQFGRVGQWIFKADAVKSARVELARRGESQERAFQQAKLLLEVSRRVSEPVEALPVGSRSAVLLTLYRDAAFWALVAARPEGAEAPSNLGRLLDEVPPDRLVEPSGGWPSVEAAKRALGEPPGPVALAASDDDVRRARALAEAAVWELEAPRRRLDRVLGQRWLHLLVVGVAALVVLFGIRTLALGPNIAAGKPFHASSSWAGCAGDLTCSALLFHTDQELNPWVEFDLGALKTFRRVDVSNRDDCCADRAIPLIVEVSKDHVTWSEVGRRDTEFSSWTAKFSPRTARYVRLRVPKQTAFHLKDVAVR